MCQENKHVYQQRTQQMGLSERVLMVSKHEDGPSNSLPISATSFFSSFLFILFSPSNSISFVCFHSPSIHISLSPSFCPAPRPHSIPHHHKLWISWSWKCELCNCELWSMKCELWSRYMWSVNYELWSCVVWSVKYEVWTMNYCVWSMNCEVWTMNCQLWSVNYEMS